MTQLRKRMLEELQRRNFSQNTIQTYLRVIEDFARHCGPEISRLVLESLMHFQIAAILGDKRTLKGN